MRHAAAVAPAFALALVLLLPVVEARMILSPNVLTVEAGGSAQFHVQLLNQGRQPLSFRVELDGAGLLTQVDRSSATIRAGDFVTLTVTVRALPWASGERVVRVVLYENDEAAPVETQEVRVQVVGGGPTALLAGGAAGAALGAGIGFALWRRWHLVALALYSRLRREHLERHPSRARLVEVVRASPGISLADAQRACGLPNGPFEHHLRKLVEAGRVGMVEHGRSRLLRLTESGPLALPAGTSASIAELVRARGPIRAADVARELDISRQALHYHVRELSREGVLVARLEKGRLVLAPG